ncbi:MAG: ammonium transporter [Burkholderiaceae bacterium]|nr:ammonium transporter [Microbacteriaceae bacterium]
MIIIGASGAITALAVLAGTVAVAGGPRPSAVRALVGCATGWGAWLAVLAIAAVWTSMTGGGQGGPTVDAGTSGLAADSGADPAGLGPGLAVLATALAGLGAALAARITLASGRRLSLVFATLWVLVVFSPVALAVFQIDSAPLGVVDLAGVLPVAVGVGAACTVVLVARRGSPVPAVPSRLAARFPPWFPPAAWALCVVWFVGMELAVDSATPVIVSNAVLGPATSALIWVILQRMLRGRGIPHGPALGMLCGLVAVGAGSGNLTAVGAVLTAAITAVVCAAIGYPLARRTGQTLWLAATVLLVGGALGTGLVGVFAARIGIFYTGQPEPAIAQFAAASAVVAWSLAGSAGAWLLAGGRRPVRPFAGSPAART